ncbi:hypothetical protein RHGRI_004455 [Rhododendron griersonianum]|uniref:Uncharacterized protein n=1 Tax=Rhododendron griersonianum TaxID=479676 RepID=A0AAV6L9G8_9ERIC|nr:hypothetical protein RHGRI_004455 [Rhododendron griersonianum]
MSWKSFPVSSLRGFFSSLGFEEMMIPLPSVLRQLVAVAVGKTSPSMAGLGPIPRGKQFDTFSNDSYVNNLALCGLPLSNTCGDSKATQPPPSTSGKEDSERGFSWEIILPGYGFGLVIGLVMGYLMFSFGKPQWLVKMVEDVGNRNGKRLKRNARRHGGRRN